MENLILKMVSASEKVFPAKEPSGEGAVSRLTALQGETVSFQIAYYWDGERKGRGKALIQEQEGIKTRIRTVGLVPCAYPCHMKRDDNYLVTEPGLYPDLLSDIGEFGFPMVSGQWRSLWVDIEAGADTQAGTYTIAVDISDMNASKDAESTDGDASNDRISVEVEILGAKLPALDIPHTEWFHCDCLANYYGVEVFSEEHWKIIENFVRTAVRRGCNMLLTPIFTPPLDTAVGGERKTVQLVDIRVTGDSYEFSYEKFERWVSMCRRCGVKYFEISHLFSQWGATMAPKIVAEVDGEKKIIFFWDTKATSEEYRSFMHQFLDSFTKKIEEMQIGKQCYFHVSDEPTVEQLDSYRAAKDMVKDQLKGYHMIDALSSHEFFKEGVIDEPVCANDHIEPFLADRPEKLWTYYCTGQFADVSNRFIAQQGSRTRVLGVQMYKYRIDGFLQWGYNFYNSEYSLYPINPYQCTDADGAFPSGDPFLVYPGKDGEPEESMRIMLMDEAMADLMAMKYLEELTDRETVMKCMENEETGEITFKQYPNTISYPSSVRAKVNEAIKNAIK
jgi:hypothetical protein